MGDAGIVEQEELKSLFEKAKSLEELGYGLLEAIVRFFEVPFESLDIAHEPVFGEKIPEMLWFGVVVLGRFGLFWGGDALDFALPADSIFLQKIVF